jgi:hypothetical protein
MNILKVKSSANLQEPTHPKRTWQGWLFLGCLFVVTIAGIQRSQQVLLNWDWLVRYGTVPGPFYIFLSGVFWAVLGIIAIVWIVFSLPWRTYIVWGIILILIGCYWIDRLSFSQAASLDTNTLFAFGVTILVIMFTISELGIPFDINDQINHRIK